MLVMSFQVEMVLRKEGWRGGGLILYKWSLMGSVEPSQTAWFALVLVWCGIRGSSGVVWNKGCFWCCVE